MHLLRIIPPAFVWLLAASVRPAAAADNSGEKLPAARPSMTARQRAYHKAVDIAPFETDQGIEKLIFFPTGKGNAADHYAKLEILYEKEKIESKSQRFHIGRVAHDSEGVQEIMAGAKIKNCRLSPTYYPRMGKGTSKQPDIVVFQAYLHGLLAHAKHLEKNGRVQQANKVYQSGLVWGWHFTSERPNLVTLMLGLSIKVQTAKAYTRFLQRYMLMDKAREANDYKEYIIKVRRRVFVKARMLLGDFNNFNCLYSGIKIAKYDRDYLWRQEAVLRLGVLRHGAPDPDLKHITKDPASQRLAEGALTHIANNDPAPWIRQLAIWAIANVTPQRFADMQSKSLFGRSDESEKEKQQKEK